MRGREGSSSTEDRTMQATYTRKTKVERFKKLDGTLVHMGDLVSNPWTSELPNGYAIEGEVVDITGQYVVVDRGATADTTQSPRFSFVHGNHVEVIVCVRG